MMILIYAMPMNANTAMRALQVVNISDSVLCASKERTQSNQMENASKRPKQLAMSEYSQSFKAFSEGVLKANKELIQQWVKMRKILNCFEEGIASEAQDIRRFRIKNISMHSS